MVFKDKKRTIIEVILALIILIQAGAIYYLYNSTKDPFKSDSCVIIWSISDYYNSGKYEKIIGLGEYFYKNGYEDKLLLAHLAEAYFIIGNERKAAEYLELSLKAGYKCKIAEPSFEKGKLMEEAFARYNLSEIYTLLGEKEKADKEHEKAHSIAKIISSDQYKYDLVENKIFKEHSIVEARKNILSKKGKSS
jgi:tetratricopeptide (TPR) repeat protein